MIHLCITPERDEKTGMLMRGLAVGFERLGKPYQLVVGPPSDDGEPFVVWGQEWLAERILPAAIRSGRPFWHIDNGFWEPGRGRTDRSGYYRLTYRGMTPILLPQTLPLREANIALQPWRMQGDHVLLAMPGIHFGRAIGIDVERWCADIQPRLRAWTGRRIIVRPRDSNRDLAEDLAGAWALVTHSSNVAVDAVIAGIPVFVEPTSPARPVGRLDLHIEYALTPDRDHWLRSLASQQFTLAEMQDGTAGQWMERIAKIVDEEAVAA